MYCMSRYLNIFCAILCNDSALKITTDFSDDVHFFLAYHFKFTINANIVKIPVEAAFSMSISYALITMVCIFSSWSVAALTVS